MDNLTVATDIVNRRGEAIAQRLEDLKRLNAPAIMVKRAEADLAAVGATVKFDGGREAYEVTFTTKEILKGKGGKVYAKYTLVNGTVINYFPNARFGAWVTFSNKEN